METRTERVRTSPSEEVDSSPQMDQPREDQSVPIVVEPAPLNIEVGTQRNDVESNEENANNIPPSQVSRSVRPSLHVDDLLLSRNVPRESSNIYNPSRDYQIRTQDIDIRGISSIPQWKEVYQVMIGKSCLMIEAVFNIIHMKESILKEHLPLTGEIPQIIVVMIVDYREEGDILMREEDPQREREIPKQ